MWFSKEFLYVTYYIIGNVNYFHLQEYLMSIFETIKRRLLYSTQSCVMITVSYQQEWQGLFSARGIELILRIRDFIDGTEIQIVPNRELQ
jgi:hypothetical protein